MNHQFEHLLSKEANDSLSDALMKLYDVATELHRLHLPQVGVKLIAPIGPDLEMVIERNAPTRCLKQNCDATKRCNMLSGHAGTCDWDDIREELRVLRKRSNDNYNAVIALEQRLAARGM